MTSKIRLAGIDLAWRSDKNPTAIAIGTLDSDCLVIEAIVSAVYSVSEVINTLGKFDRLLGIAIDAPLIIGNESGQRVCEKEIGVAYGSRKASCHTSNKQLYPDASSVELSKRLSDIGFIHSGTEKWQIECYPHPAIIEIFGLEERLMYKKGRVSEMKSGQIALAGFIRSLSFSPIIKLNWSNDVSSCMDSDYIESLSGQDLKNNEDVLDSILCLYIAALYSKGSLGKAFGNINDGYIWVPQTLCV